MVNLQGLGVNPADFICIDIYDPHPGRAINEYIIGQLAINYQQFYGWCNANPSNLKIVRINSDSMEPTIPTGSLIIFDSSVMEYAGDGIYLIVCDEQIMLKRMQKTSSDNYLLKSENPRYQDIRCATSEIEILGRAINCLSSRPL